VNKIAAENMEQKTVVHPQETEMVDPLLREGGGGEGSGGVTQKRTAISAPKTSWS